MGTDALETARHLFASGRTQDAIRWVEKCADAGDVNALCALAHWRLFGLYGSRDEAAAHIYLDRALERGAEDAARLKVALLSSGRGCVRDEKGAAELLRLHLSGDELAMAQLSAWEELRDWKAPEPAQCLAEGQQLFLLANMLTEQGCRYLQQLAKPRLRPSFVIDPKSGQRRPDSIRTSNSASLGPDVEDLLVSLLNDRIAAASGTSRDQGEPLHILRYQGSQEYRLHSDVLPQASNQRIWTVIVYLNDDYEAGETAFPALNLKLKGKRGDALLFRNIDGNGKADSMMRHAGLPPENGEKWVATRWIRAAPLTI